MVGQTLLLLLLVVGVFGMHSLAAGGMSGMGTMPAASTSSASSSSTSPSGAATVALVSTHQALPGAAATGSASHSMGHDCVVVLTDAPTVALGVLPVAAVPGDLPDRTPATVLRAVGAALGRAPLRPAPSLSELSILRV